MMLTFGLVESLHVTLQFAYGFVVFIFFDAVVHNPSTRLKICDTIFENSCPDCYARIHRVGCKIESTDGASIHPTTLLFQAVYELDGFYFWCSRYGACGEYRTKCIE